VERLETSVSWTDARCATRDAALLELFFSEEAADISRAKAICSECPLRLPCYEGALERREPWGVWGGWLFDRGQPLEQRRLRGRPRKVPVAPDEAPKTEEVAEVA
jgi:WhiB family transcriptional regulator, redox-sensing transcriptional regulator